MSPFRVVRSSPRCGTSPLLGSLLFATLLFAPSLLHGIPSSASAAVQPVPAGVCACSSSHPAPAGGVPRLFPRPPPIFQNYDEQIGLTFTQSFTSIEYNVTALAQTDPSLGTGPAYLVNGLSDSGYWYQVGVSWDWAPGDTPGTGLDMNYEVWDNLGNSIYPAGQGGLVAFSGPVRAGDIVALDLYFSNTTGNVVMLAHDTATGANASESYSSEGGSYFVGLPDSVANSNGYFTGLMTEWYHGLPYYADENPIVYSNPHSALTSAWMWLDEFNAGNSSLVFENSTSSAVSFTASPALQEFSYNGTTEFADPFEFVTGAIPNAASSSSIPLVLSFSVEGSVTGYTPPVLNYVSNGEHESAPLTRSPTLYFADNGTDWSVSSVLGGSGSTQRWETNQTIPGVATSALSIELIYFEQEYVDFGFTVSGGGSGYSPPTVTYSSFGQNSSTPPGAGVWADIGSRYQYENPLQGSTSSERWFAESTGIISQSAQVDVTYYNQYLLTFELSFKNTELLPSLSLLSTFAGKAYSVSMIEGANEEWLDSGASYSAPQSFIVEAGQRFVTNGSYTGDVAGSATVGLVYERQFYEQIITNPPGGGTASPATGWYDSGTVLQLVAIPSEGWQFEGWQGLGSDSVSGSQPRLILTVGPGTPSIETVVFYAGVTVQAGGPSSVSYKDGSISGSVSGGATKVVFIPPGSTLTLMSSGVPVLTSFSGWRGASNSTSASVTIPVNGPATIDATSGYDIFGVAGLVLIAAVTVGATTVSLRRRRALRRSGTGQTNLHPPE